MRFLRFLRLTLPIFISLLFSACWGKQTNVPKGNGSGFTGIIKSQESTPSKTESPKSVSISSKTKQSSTLEYIAPEMGKKVKSMDASNLIWGKTKTISQEKFHTLKNIEIPIESIEKLEVNKDEVIENEKNYLPSIVATAESQVEQSLEQQSAFVVVPQSEAQNKLPKVSGPAALSEKVIFWMQKNDESKLVEKIGSLKLSEDKYSHPIQDVWDIYQQDELAAVVTDDFTISASFRFISKDKPNFFFHGPSFQLIYFLGRLQFRYLDPGSNPPQRSLSVPLDIKMGSSHRIQIVRTQSTLRFYLDGQQVDEAKIEGDFSVFSDLNKFYLFLPVVKQRAQIEFDEVKITLP